MISSSVIKWHTYPSDVSATSYHYGIIKCKNIEFHHLLVINWPSFIWRLTMDYTFLICHLKGLFVRPWNKSGDRYIHEPLPWEHNQNVIIKMWEIFLVCCNTNMTNVALGPPPPPLHLSISTIHGKQILSKLAIIDPWLQVCQSAPVRELVLFALSTEIPETKKYSC